MLRLGIQLESEDHREIVKPAIHWGFELKFPGDNLGRPSIRRSLEQAGHEARRDAHGVLRQEFEAFLKDAELETRENWYLQAIRTVIQTLLANPACVSSASELVAILKKVNQIQRARPQSASRPLFSCVRSRQLRRLDLDVFGMKHGQAGYLLEVVLLIERQDFSNAIIFHNDAVDHVPHS